MLKTTVHHRSTLAAAHTSPLLQQQVAYPRCQPQQNNRQPRVPAALPEASLALLIGFLPWTGCSQGGFYDTGVQGVHGSNCQAIYQPAAAAEARFAASLRTSSGSSSSSSSSGSAAATTAQDADVGQPDRTTGSPSLQQQQQQQQDVSISQQLHQVVPEAAKELARDILREDNRARTKQLVDDAWQTLE